MIFISYRHEDTKDFSWSLADKLADHFGKEAVFIDKENILAGENWRTKIETAIAGCKVVLAVIGPKWLLASDKYGRRHIDLENDVLAYELETALRGQKIVIPLYVDKTAELEKEALPDRLKPLTDPQAIKGFQLPRDLEQLKERLRQIPDSDRRPPYKEWLKPMNFETEKSFHLHGFTGREWVEERLDFWIQKRRSSKVFCLLGGPGIGKSAIACHWSYSRGDIIAYHYCVHDYAERIDPRKIFFSLAAQIAEHLPEYERRLDAIGRKEMEEIADKRSARAVFEDLLLNLLKPDSGSFSPTNGDRLVIIDGLDEATTGETNELAEVIGKVWVGLPDWLRLVVTARPELEVSDYLSSLHPFILNASDPENIGDIHKFLRRQLAPDQASDEMISEIVAKSEGMFLYAHLVLDDIGSDRLTPERIANFPQGLSGFYKEWFGRKFPDGREYRQEFSELVSVIVAQKTPLPLEVLSRAVGLNMHQTQMRLRRMGVLFPLRDEQQGSRSITYVTLMHKSLHDWLTNRNPANSQIWAGAFASDVERGNHLLAEEGWRVYTNGNLEKDAYFREALLAHLAEDNQNERLQKILLDSRLVDSLWYYDKRIEWQRHIGSLRYKVSLSKIIHEWLCAHQSPQIRTAVDAVAAGKLCRLFHEIGAFDEAMALGEAALRIWRENRIENSPEMVDTYLAVGDIQSKRELLDNATDSHEKALEIAKRAYAPDSPQMADALYRMNVFYSSSKRDYKKAAACLDKCYEIYKTCSPPDLVGMANCINDRAVNYERERMSADNLALYREALSLFESASPLGHPEMVSTLTNVAYELRKELKENEALPLLRRAVTMAEVVLLPQHEYCENARSSLCSTLLQLGQIDEALKVMRQHVAEHERYPGESHVDTSEARFALCRALWTAALSEKAPASGRRLSEIRDQCQLIHRAKPQTILNLLDLANDARKAAEMNLYGQLREAARRGCRESEPGAGEDQPGLLPGACYGQIVELVLSDQPVSKIRAPILDAWRDEAPKLVQNADLLPRTRKAITRLLGWYGAVRLDKDDDIVSVREAFDLITQIGADSPDTLDHLAGLTVTLHHRQADETSEVLCQDLLERAERILGADHAESHTYLKNLAFLRMCRGKLEEAKCLFQRALETHLRESGLASFGSIDAKTSIAECLLIQGRMEEARQFIRDFAQKLPTQQGDASPCKTLSSVLNVTAKRQKNTFANYGAARICYELSLEFDPGSTEVHSNFALLLWACLHEHDAADLHFRRSLELNDRNSVVHGIYGLFLGQERDDIAGAIEHFEKAEALNPYDPATLGNHASVLLVSGNIDAAWSLAKQAMRFCRQSPDRMMCRALFDGAAALLLLDRSPSVPLGQLKTLFARRIDHAPWVITALLKKLQEKLSPASFALVAAASAAIDDKEQLARLQQNRAWQAIKALPLEPSWPDI